MKKTDKKTAVRVITKAAKQYEEKYNVCTYLSNEQEIKNLKTDIFDELISKDFLYSGNKKETSTPL